jgi:hypothetical protein
MLAFLLRAKGETVEFEASGTCFHARLQAAFVRLYSLVGRPKAKLEVKHSIHGWLLVCDSDERYPIIDNPLLINSRNLWLAARHTLAQGDAVPSEEQRRELKRRRQVKQRGIEAEMRRRRFELVKG